MAGLLLLASAGITLHKHYCMGRLKNVAVFEKAESCMAMMGMEKDEDCPMDCCKDTSEEIKIDDLKKVSEQINLVPDLKVLAVVTYFLIDFDLVSRANHYTSYLNYKPPLIDQDIPVLVQSFLI